VLGRKVGRKEGRTLSGTDIGKVRMLGATVIGDIEEEGNNGVGDMEGKE
jgi:hypothetical protein